MVSIDKTAVSKLIRKFGLGCMVEFREGGVVTLLDYQPISKDRVALAFQGWMITDAGKRTWKHRPDDMGEHYYVDIAPVQ